MSKRTVATFAVGLATVATAHADRYEATAVARPVATVARVAEPIGDDGRTLHAAVPGGGLEVGLSYGLRNFLDLGVEVRGATFGLATYDPATVEITGVANRGRVTRRTRADVQLRAGATLRLGVGWVPTIYLGVGGGMRIRGAATLVATTAGTSANTVPDGLDTDTSLELVALARIGLTHRVTRRWSLGLTVGAGCDTRNTAALEGGVGLGYTWYPLW